jgi:glycine/D-amino acid oxidase-like deaminating enzyme
VSRRFGRRRLLGGMAGVAAGASLPGCPRPAREIAARFVGPSPERGHLLRDRAVPDATIAERISTSVVIVGGGAAGMAAAWRLHRAGVHDVRVLELEDATGGTARSGAHERSAYPMGAHYLPAPHPSFRALKTLLAELGVIVGRIDRADPDYDPRFVCRSPVERHRAQGRWHEGLYPGFRQTADDEAQWETWRDHLRQMHERRGADGRRLFDLPVRNSSEELRALDRVSMATYLDRLGLHGQRLRWTIDYACRDDYGCMLEQTSAFAALHHFLARGLEDEVDRFLLTWPQGNAWLVDGMASAAELEGRVHLATAAQAIDPASGTVRAWDVAASRALELRAKVVLWAAPRFVLPYVLPAGADPLPRGALTYAPWLVANVEVDRAPAGIGAPLAWDNVGTDTDDLGYVVANHLEPRTEAVRPGAVITFYRPLTAGSEDELRARRQELLSGSLAAWCDHVVARLEHLHPGITPQIAAIDVTRWGHGMVRPIPGHLFGPALATARAPIGCVIPCGADVGGLPLFEEAFTSGVAAAEEALARLGRPEASLL